MADYVCLSDQKVTCFPQLQNLPLCGQIETDNGLISELLAGDSSNLRVVEAKAGDIGRNRRWIDSLMPLPLPQILSTLCDYQEGDAWLSQARDRVIRGCPVSFEVIEKHWQRCRGASLERCFQEELRLSLNCVRLGHLHEGIRALMIDKDRAPRWQPGHWGQVFQQDIDAHFAS